MFAPTAEEVVSNDEDRFVKISVHFKNNIFKTKSVTPIYFCISGTSNSLAISSRSFIKLSMLEDFRANVL